MKSEIDNILGKLYGTREYEILIETERFYNALKAEQAAWYAETRFLCPDGCGSCCVNFEPDLLECEALYMAAWLLENKYDVAVKVAEEKYPFDNGKTCPFYDESGQYHCSIYGGRPFICRLFGASCSGGKDGGCAWRPCRFYPDELLAAREPPIERKQYSESEAKSVFSVLPPVMSDVMEQALSVSPDSVETVLLRGILPETIRRLLWICSMNGNDTPRGSPGNNAA